MNDNTHRHALAPGYRLHWYLIERVLGQGGFGMTYLARDENLNQPVAIKEYLPRDLAVREQDDSVQPLSGEHGSQFQWGLDRFIAEARTLAQFRHPNIVRVLAVFEANHTAYMAMEYEEGESLHQVLGRRKTLEEMELTRILMPLLHGLEKVHAAGFIHRDIKPANIYLRQDGSPVLLDFGSARQALGEETRTLTSLVSPGYAPFEQYVSKSDKQGPWTDIYGMGATLYRAVTGRTPSVAVDRSEALLESTRDILVQCTQAARGRYSERFLNAIDHALAFKPQDRPQTIADWRREFEGMIAVPRPDQIATEVAAPRTAPTTPTERPQPPIPVDPAAPVPARSSRRAFAIAAVLALAALLGWRHHVAAGKATQAAVSTPASAVSAPAVPATPSVSEPPANAAAVSPEPATGPSNETPAPAAPADAAASSEPPAQAQTQPAAGAASPEAPAEPAPEPAAKPAPASADATSVPEAAAATAPTAPAAAERSGAQTYNKQPGEFYNPQQQRRALAVERLAGNAKLAAERGNYAQAEYFLNRALRLAPHNPKLLEARRQLARLRSGGQ